jgi:hypothetical protein
MTITSKNGRSDSDGVDTYASTAGGEGTGRPAVVEAEVSAPIVAALERAWAAIRVRHPQVPPVVVVLASGSDGAPAGWLKLGHFAAMRWETGARDQSGHDESGPRVMAEVFVGGEGLARGPVAVLGTLLHEATHALAHVRGVKDTSRQGRYHNQRFADLAGELGLEVAQIAPIGWSDTRITETTRTQYAATVDDLRRALTIFRRREGAIFGPTGGQGEGLGGGDSTRTGQPGEPRTRGRSSNNGLACTCDCGRRIRVAPTVLEAGAITCALCGAAFTPHPHSENDSDSQR